MAPSPKTRIMAFGTFDILHQGHLNLFKQARALAENPFLIVSVARDFNVKKIKGRPPSLTEKQRLAEIKNCRLVDKVVLGGLKNHVPHILKQKPQIIALGYDQSAYVNNLGKTLEKRGLKVKIARLKAFRPKIYKSSLFKAIKVD